MCVGSKTYVNLVKPMKILNPGKLLSYSNNCLVIWSVHSAFTLFTPSNMHARPSNVLAYAIDAHLSKLLDG